MSHAPLSQKFISKNRSFFNKMTTIRIAIKYSIKYTHLIQNNIFIHFHLTLVDPYAFSTIFTKNSCPQNQKLNQYRLLITYMFNNEGEIIFRNYYYFAFSRELNVRNFSIISKCYDALPVQPQVDRSHFPRTQFLFLQKICVYSMTLVSLLVIICIKKLNVI